MGLLKHWLLLTFDIPAPSLTPTLLISIRLWTFSTSFTLVITELFFKGKLPTTRSRGNIETITQRKSGERSDLQQQTVWEEQHPPRLISSRAAGKRSAAGRRGNVRSINQKDVTRMVLEENKNWSTSGRRVNSASFNNRIQRHKNQLI